MGSRVFLLLLQLCFEIFLALPSPHCSQNPRACSWPQKKSTEASYHPFWSLPIGSLSFNPTHSESIGLHLLDSGQLCPCTLSPPTPWPHSPWGIGSLGLCLDGRPRAPQEGLGGGAHAVVVVAVEWGAVGRGWEGAMAPRGWSTPRGAQMVEPAGAGNGWWPVGEGGCAGWCRDVREAAVGKGGGSAPRSPGLRGSSIPSRRERPRSLS